VGTSISSEHGLGRGGFWSVQAEGVDCAVVRVALLRGDLSAVGHADVDEVGVLADVCEHADRGVRVDAGAIFDDGAVADRDVGAHDADAVTDDDALADRDVVSEDPCVAADLEITVVHEVVHDLCGGVDLRGCCESALGHST